MVQASVVHMGEGLGMTLTMRVISLGFGMGPAFLLSHSGITKSGLAGQVPDQSTMFVPLMSHDFVQSTSASMCQANTNDLAMPLVSQPNS